MFKLETDILRKAVSLAVNEVYDGDNTLHETLLRLAATEMIAEIGRAYIVKTKYNAGESCNIFGYFSDVDLVCSDAVSKTVYEITKLDYGYAVVEITDMFI